MHLWCIQSLSSLIQELLIQVGGHNRQMQLYAMYNNVSLKNDVPWC